MTAADSDHERDGISALIESLFGGDPLSDDRIPSNAMSLSPAPDGLSQLYLRKVGIE